MPPDGPTSRARRLGIELKRCREAVPMTQEQVSAHFEWHIQKVSRIETARVRVTPRDVKDMLTLYGVSDEEYREGLINLARRSKERAWWTDYKDVMRSGSFIGLEDDAASERLWEPTLLPGLFQTEGYMRALIAVGRPDDSQGEIDRRIEFRLARQGRLRSDNPLYVSAIIDESVPRRLIGGHDVMTGQWKHLLDLMELPNINIQFLPLDAGEHAILGGPVALLEFKEYDYLDTAYLEGIAGDYYEDDPAEVAKYRRTFERLSATALNRNDSANLIKKLLQ